MREIVEAKGISHGSVVSPDLTPSDYFLFPNLKKWFGGKRFYSNDEIISQTNTYFEDLEKSYFLVAIQKLETRWTKCIELNLTILKNKKLFMKKPLFDLKSHTLIDPPLDRNAKCDGSILE